MLISLLRMGFSFGTFMAILVAYLLVLLISFSAHEFSHAFTAYRHGDPTAKILGRMTLNPFAHYDLYGFVCLIIFGFGWAKPVPINVENLRKGKRSIFAVSIAGVLANLMLALIFSFAFSLVLTLSPNIFISGGFWTTLLSYFLNYGISINLSLAIFNLLPFYPLDGNRILELILRPNSKIIDFLKKYSTLILICIFALGILNILISYAVTFLGMGMVTMWSSLFSLFV